MLKTIIICLLLSSCTMKDILGIVKPSPSLAVDTEIVIGDKTTEVAVQKAESIVNNNNAPVWLIGLAMLGWFLPTPQGMIRMWRRK